MKDPLKRDPTRTTMIRKRMMLDFSRRFRKLKGKIIKLIGTDDVFGLKKADNPLKQNTRWKFLTDSEKVEQFSLWLKQHINRDIIELKSQELEDAYWYQYSYDGYKKGQGRAFDDMKAARKAALENTPLNEAKFTGAKEEFLTSAFSHPVAIDKLKQLSGRVLSDLEGVTEAMAVSMKRTLLDGLSRGDSPRKVARDLNEKVDKIGRTRALTIARTETIRAHAEGQLDALESMGVEELRVMVEWSTTGDDRVCKMCQPLQGMVVKMKEARGMLPRHPNCRCAWLPSGVGESTKGQKRSKRAATQARDESIDAEIGARGANLSKAKRRKASKWSAADRDFTIRNNPLITPSDQVKKSRSQEVKKSKPTIKSKQTRHSKENVPENRRLPKGFHLTGNSLKSPDVKVPKIKTKGLEVISGGKDPNLKKEIRQIAIPKPRHGAKYSRALDMTLDDALKSGESLTTTLKNRMDTMSGKGKTFEDMLELSKDTELLKKLDTKILGASNIGDTQKKKLIGQGYQKLPKRGDDVRKSVGDELTKILGKPEESTLSPSQYWFDENGRSIRISNHDPIYFFEDSGVNFVPLQHKHVTDLYLDGSKGETYYNPKIIADELIKANRKLLPVDVKNAEKRITETGLWTKQDQTKKSTLKPKSKSIVSKLENPKVREQIKEYKQFIEDNKFHKTFEIKDSLESQGLRFKDGEWLDPKVAKQSIPVPSRKPTSKKPIPSKSLTPKSAPPTQREVDAVESWWRGGDVEIQYSLREGEYNPDSRHLNSFISKSPALKKDTTFYRGISIEPEDFLSGKISEGSVIKDKGFTAVSPDQSVAKRFSEWGSSDATSVIFEINIPKGTKMAKIPSGLNEHLLPSDTGGIKILKVTESNGIKTVEAEYIK